MLFNKSLLILSLSAAIFFALDPNDRLVASIFFSLGFKCTEYLIEKEEEEEEEEVYDQEEILLPLFKYL